MKLKDKLRMRFLLFFGRFYFGAILFIVAAIAIFIIIGLAESDRASNIGSMGKLFVFLFVIAAALIKGAFKAMFFRLPKPEGVLLKKKEVPELYSVIESVRKATKCPKIHHILLDFEFNAFISERPSIGMFGLYRRYLVIGMPLLLTLSEAELKAVIAHECGHLSKSHGKSSVKIYRSKTAWENIAKEFDKEGSKGSFLVDGFIKRYLPALNAIYFSSSKQHEYEADKKSLAVADKQTFANALMKVTLYSSVMESNFWPGIGKLNSELQNPMEDVFFRMESEASNPIPEETVNICVDKLMSYISLPCSTHPSYAERLKSIGADKPIFMPADVNALRKILKSKADTILRTCSSYWNSRAAEGWTKYYNNTIELRNKLSELEKKSAIEQLTVDESLEKAFTIERLEGTDNAIASFKAVKEAFPDSLAAEYNLGRLLIYKGNDEGVELLRNVMEKDSQAIPDCCYDIVNYYCYKNDQATASQYYDYAVKFMKTNDAVKKERSSILYSDHYLPHDLSEASVLKIREKLLEYKEIKKAYIAIKYVKMSYQFPIYIIGIKFGLASKSRRDAIITELANAGLMPWDYWIIGLSEKNIVIGYNLDKVPGVRII